MTRTTKNFIFITFTIILSLVLLTFSYSSNIQKSISDKVIRLHILANSNSPEDQNLKLLVRDRILKEGKNIFSPSDDMSSCLKKLDSFMPALLAAAKDEIAQNGYSYDVNISAGKYAFPMKTYGNIALPSGEYNALRIEIGKGEGENWWCVMFPPLCFVNGCIEDKSSLSLLSETFSEEEMSLVNSSEGINFRFKTVDFIQSAFCRLKTAFKK